MSEKPSEHWYEKAADAIVREGKPLFQFTNEANYRITSKECENILRSKAFQEVLRTRRNVYYRELAQDPSQTRAAVEGQLVFIINKLIEQGSYDKAANAALQLAKLKGWTSDQANVSVFSGLSQKELEDLRKKFRPAATAVPVH